MIAIAVFGSVAVVSGCALVGWFRWLAVQPKVTAEDWQTMKRRIDEIEHKANVSAARKLGV
jgi:hypothetical protein